jgi:hypothetical protein
MIFEERSLDITYYKIHSRSYLPNVLRDITTCCESELTSLLLNSFIPFNPTLEPFFARNRDEVVLRVWPG